MENIKKEINRSISSLSDNFNLLEERIKDGRKELSNIHKKLSEKERQLEIATKLLANIYQSGYTNISYILKLIQDWEVDVNDIEILYKSIYLVGTEPFLDSDLEELIETILSKALDNSGIDRSKTIIYKHDVNKFNWWIEIDGINFGNYRQLMDYLY